MGIPILASEEAPNGLVYLLQGYEETATPLAFQPLGGVKFFVIKYLALFGEAKWSQGWHTFKYETDFYWERYSISTIHLVGGVALHF